MGNNTRKNKGKKYNPDKTKNSITHKSDYQKQNNLIKITKQLNYPIGNFIRIRCENADNYF